MRAVVQRVYDASVSVGGSIVGSIQKGLLVYLGVHGDDNSLDSDYITKKILRMRVYPEDEKPMHLSVIDVGGSLLIISQFTLFGSLIRGNRPDYFSAAKPQGARPLYDEVCEKCAEYVTVEKGIFGEHMKVTYTNDGPVTLIVTSDHLSHHT